MFNRVALIVVLCSAVAVYSLPIYSKDLDALIERGVQLINETNQIIKDHQANERGHLLQAVEIELKDIVRIVDELKLVQPRINQTARLVVDLLEEQLMHSEHRLDDELDFLEEIYKNDNKDGKSYDELLAYGKILLPQAKARIAQIPAGHPGYPEFVTIENELKLVEQWLSKVEAAGPAVTQNEEHILARHMYALRNLLAHLDFDHPTTTVAPVSSAF